MAIMRCSACCGSKMQMGGGMVKEPCELCNGKGSIDNDPLVIESKESTETKKITIDRRSAAYKAAVDKIKLADPSLSNDQAKEMFEKALVA